MGSWDPHCQHLHAFDNALSQDSKGKRHEYWPNVLYIRDSFRRMTDTIYIQSTYTFLGSFIIVLFCSLLPLSLLILASDTHKHRILSLEAQKRTKYISSLNQGTLPIQQDVLRRNPLLRTQSRRPSRLLLPQPRQPGKPPLPQPIRAQQLSGHTCHLQPGRGSGHER